MSIVAYTDGSCSKNPGPGGWAFIIYNGMNKIHSSGGRMDNSTNNIMELTAISECLKYIINSGVTGVRIHTDSRYVHDGITKWLPAWIRNNWVTSSGGPVKNLELWKEINASLQHKNQLAFSFEWVQAHASDIRNNEVDTLAKQYRDAR